MKHRVLILTVLTLVFAVPAFAAPAASPAPVPAPAAPAQAQTYPGPQEAAPNVYHQIFENDSVRVSEITFNPGDKAPMHTHPYAHFVYVIEPGTLTLSHPDGTSQIVTAEAGQVMWMEAETHEAVNTGTTRLKALVSEIKK